VRPFLHLLYGDAYYGRPSLEQWVTVTSQLFLDKQHKTLDEWRVEKGDPLLELGDYAFDAEAVEDAATLRNKAVAEYAALGLSFAGTLQALGGNALYTPDRVVVVCDALTYSAAFHFLYYLHELGATVVGVPPGQSPNAPMETTPFRLPRSGIQGTIANSMQVFLPDRPDARVWEPDFEVTYAVLRRYGFDEHAAVRYALDLLATGEADGEEQRR